MARRRRPINGRSAKVYGTYVFRDKDPVIDLTRKIVEQSNMSYTAISKVSGVSTTTMSNWFRGPTRRPSFCCVNAVGRACGQTLIWADIKR